MPVYNNTEYIRLMHPLPKFVKRDIYGIPVIEPDDIDIQYLNNGKWLVNYFHANASGKNQANKIVHGFAMDARIKKPYTEFYSFLSRISGYYAICTPDYSMDDKMDFHGIFDAVYRNRWVGAFAQCHGKRVIATVGWVGKEYYDITFAGLRNGGTFIISTLGTRKAKPYDEFISGYTELRNRFPSSKIICVGTAWENMDSDVCLIPFDESFGSWDKKNTIWQPKLFNWDMSVATEVI